MITMSIPLPEEVTKEEELPTVTPQKLSDPFTDNTVAGTQEEVPNTCVSCEG